MTRNQPAYSSEIRYDLRTGFPDLEIVPQAALAAITQQLLMERRGLQYAGDLQGIAPTREQVAHFINQHIGMPTAMDDVMISSGALWGIDATCRAMTQPGQIVLVEDPTFFFAINILRMSHVDVIGVPLREDGLDLEVLQALIDEYGERISLLYLIPSFQNPTGVCYSLENRQAVVALAQQHKLTIIEDSTYHLLYFDQAPPPTLREIDDNHGSVVTVGSFSKILMPALRQGWIWATPDKMQVIRNYKSDSAASAFNSEMVAEFLKSGGADVQVEKAKALYGGKYHQLADALNEALPDFVEWSVPGGGFFIWLTLPEGMSAQHVHQLANAQDTDFLPGSFCFVGDAPDRYIRLCFAMQDEATLREGAARLGAVLQDVAR